MSSQTSTDTPSLSLLQLKRIVSASYFTPSRSASAGISDPITAAQTAQADQQWLLDYSATHGRQPTEEQVASRLLASRTVWGCCPILILGPPGVGKTAIGEGFAKSQGLRPNTIIASQQQPEDVGGFAIPDLEARRMVRLPDTWIDTVNTARDGAVQCFDELTTADESMMAALLRVFSDRAAGDRLLASRVRLIAFGNRPGEAPNARTLDPAAANRFAHFTFEGSDADGWCSWLLDELDQEVTKRDANQLEARVLAAWPTAFARAKTQIAGYVKSNPMVLHAMTKGDANTRLRADQPGSCGPWTSHRTWEIAARALAGADVHGLTETETRLWLTGIIGDEADGLMSWITDQDLPDLSEMLRTRGRYTCRKTGKLKTWKHVQKRLDRTYGVLTGLAMTLRDSKASSTPEELVPQAEWLWSLLHDVGGKDADMVVRPAITLRSADLIFMTATDVEAAKTDPDAYKWHIRDGGADAPPTKQSWSRRVCLEITMPLVEAITGTPAQTA